MTFTLARWLHSLQMLLALPAQFVRLWWRGREHPLWRRCWHERLVWGGARAQAGSLWLHARTAGEVRMAGVLMAELRRLNPSWRYLLTHGEAEGRAEARTLLEPGDVQVWLPFDTPGAARRFLRRHQPRVGVLMEQLAQPNLLHCAERAGVPVMMANARLPEGELRRVQRWSALTLPGFRSLALVLAQSDADAQRLAKAGAQQVRTFGNLKFDVEPPLRMLARGVEWRQTVARPVVLAAGTRQGEEAALLRVWVALPAPRPLLVIVPRGGKRLARIGFEVRRHGLVLRRRSAWGRALPPAEARQADVWLGDTTNEMAMYYGLADVALLGGSFGREHDGQNLIEASACGCPVLIGPHAGRYANVADLAVGAGAAERASNIAEAVRRATGLAANPMRDAWVRNAFAFTQAHRGTVNRVVGALLALITTRSRGGSAGRALPGH